MQEVMAKSGMLIVMQQMNPAARWVDGAFNDDCLVGLDHAVLPPFVLAHCKNTHNAEGIVKAEGSKFECVEKRLHNKKNDGKATIVVQTTACTCKSKQKRSMGM